MQIVEAAEGWVRVAELRLRRRGTPLEFVLYPMFHVGLPEFYAEVSRRLAGVDVVVLEGVRGSRVGPGLASAYLELARDPRTGLVRQWTEIPPNAVVVRPDSPGAEFDERWRTVPLAQRAAVWLGVGYVRAGHRLLGSGWHLGHLRGATMDDLPTDEEILEEEIFEDVERVMLHERDERLLQALATLHEQRSHEEATVAVVWGAAHMRAVVHGLGERGYRVYAAEWLTAIDA